MHPTYEETARAQALSGRLGALRQEATALEHDAFVTISTLARAKTIEAEIVFLEFIEKEWKEAHEREIARQKASEEPEDQGWYGDPPTTQAAQNILQILSPKEINVTARAEIKADFDAFAQALQPIEAHEKAKSERRENGEARPLLEDQSGERGQPPEATPI